MNQFLVYCLGLGTVVVQAPYTWRYIGCNLAELHMIVVYIKRNFILLKELIIFVIWITRSFFYCHLLPEYSKNWVQRHGWLRHHATSQEDKGLIPDEVTRIFQ
jgi:hypothetical protein